MSNNTSATTCAHKLISAAVCIWFVLTVPVHRCLPVGRLRCFRIHNRAVCDRTHSAVVPAQAVAVIRPSSPIWTTSSFPFDATVQQWRPVHRRLTQRESPRRYRRMSRQRRPRAHHVLAPSPPYLPLVNRPSHPHIPLHILSHPIPRRRHRSSPV